MTSEREAGYHLGTPKERNMSKNMKTVIVLTVVITIALVAGGLGLAFSGIFEPAESIKPSNSTFASTTTTLSIEQTTTASTTETTTMSTSVTTTTSLTEWSEWSKCTVTCGLGQQIRSRTNETATTEIDTKECRNPSCLTGDQQIDIEAQKARDNGFNDNLFLSRYAKTVNSCERTKRSSDNQTEFYGLWKMTQTQLELVFDEISDDNCDGYCPNLISNLIITCGSDGIENVTDYSLYDENPCYSSVAFISLLIILDIAPQNILPQKPSEQLVIARDLLGETELSVNLTRKWEKVMDKELESVRDKCSQVDIDFEFVIDASGSIGQESWELTRSLIADKWIEDVLRPSDSRKCGNQVAGRWFSTNSQRFQDFEPSSKSAYPNQTYTQYVADKFRKLEYEERATCTGYALERVRVEDIPTARSNFRKDVMLFTDGKSACGQYKTYFTDSGPYNYLDPYEHDMPVNQEARLLHSVTDRVYAFGIGSDVDQAELNQIASKPQYVANMQSFDDLENFIRLFVLVQGGCESTNRKVFRSAANFETRGMSYKTAKESCLAEELCIKEVYCPTEENRRDDECTKCSIQAVQNEREFLNQISQNVIAAAEQSCFPSDVILALVSRLSGIRKFLPKSERLDNLPRKAYFTEDSSQVGLRPCKLSGHSNEMCYGLMHIPESLNPDQSVPGDSTEHFADGIQKLIDLSVNLGNKIISYNSEQVMRLVLASYDAGFVTVLKDLSDVDKYTTNNDFSADILARAYYMKCALGTDNSYECYEEYEDNRGDV